VFLLVEDEALSRRAFAEILRNQRKEVMEAEDGTVIDLVEALRQRMKKIPEKNAVGNRKARRKA
jgi:CheY-like chemotaxis protein